MPQITCPKCKELSFSKAYKCQNCGQQLRTSLLVKILVSIALTIMVSPLVIISIWAKEEPSKPDVDSELKHMLSGPFDGIEVDVTPPKEPADLETCTLKSMTITVYPGKGPKGEYLTHEEAAALGETHEELGHCEGLTSKSLESRHLLLNDKHYVLKRYADQVVDNCYCDEWMIHQKELRIQVRTDPKYELPIVLHDEFGNRWIPFNVP